MADEPQPGTPSNSAQPAAAPAPVASETSPASSAAPRPPRRGWVGIVILLAGIAAGVLNYVLHADDTTLVVFNTLKFIVPATVGMLLIWWLFLMPISRKAKGIGVAAFAGFWLLFFAIFKLDHFEGDMIPVFVLRWEQTAAERNAARWEGRAIAAAPVVIQEGGELPRLEIGPDDWPQFRGPRRDGVAQNMPIRRDWKANPPELLWKRDVGEAWSSVSVVGDYLYTQEQRGQYECVVCYSLKDGGEVWVHADEVRHSTPLGGVGPRCTPTLFDSRLYALGAEGDLNCLDPLTGGRYWSTNILEDAGARNVAWGMSGSPVIHEEMVLVNPGGKSGKSVAAYHRLTGERLWQAGDVAASYAGVRVETIHGAPQILLYDAQGVAGLDPRDGRGLWRFDWTNSEGINVAQPVVREERLVFVSSGYGTGSVLLEVQQSGDRWSVEPVWTAPNRFKMKFNDPVYYDGYLYGLDEGILACIEFATGKQQWKRGRYGHGQLVLVNDLLIVQRENGGLALVEATPDEFRELATFDALEGITWNNPVAAHGKLLVRNTSTLACYDISAPQADAGRTSAPDDASGEALVEEPPE